MMETEAKYYIPEIEEFFVGFEFEHFNYEGKLISDPRWNKQEWHKEICDADWFNILLDEYEHDEEAVKDYRVKYLDAEDIESLGFIRIDDLNEYVQEYKKDYWFIRRQPESTIHGVGALIVQDNCDVIHFRGRIKNKSELKQVLKMIGVE